MAMLPHQYLASHCHHGADLISRSVGQPFVPVLCQRGWHPGWNVGVDLSQRLGKNHASDGTLWHLMASFPRNITGLVVLQKSGELTMFADDVGLPDHVPNVQRSQQSRPQALYDAT